MAPIDTRIALLPIGTIPEIIPKTIAAHIQGYLNLNADILLPLKSPAYAHDEKRLQYNAGTIIKSLESSSLRGYAKIIGILDVDIFVPIFTHVFGEARQGGTCALVSIYRLKKDSPGSALSTPLLLERAAKVALHESGHLFNLFHCAHENCIMNYSGGLRGLDSISLYFCRYCTRYLQDAIGRLRKGSGF